MLHFFKGQSRSGFFIECHRGTTAGWTETNNHSRGLGEGNTTKTTTKQGESSHESYVSSPWTQMDSPHSHKTRDITDLVFLG